MHKRIVKRLSMGLFSLLLLSGLLFCVGNDRANSLVKNEKLTTAKSLGQAFVDVAKKVQPAVVNITTEKTVRIFLEAVPSKISSGVLVFLRRKKEKEERNTAKSREVADRGSSSIRKVMSSPIIM